MNDLIKAVLTASALLFFSTGCVYQTIDSTDVLKSNQFCADKGGVKRVKITFVGIDSVTCLSGDRSLLKPISLIRFSDKEHEQ